VDKVEHVVKADIGVLLAHAAPEPCVAALEICWLVASGNKALALSVGILGILLGFTVLWIGGQVYYAIFVGFIV
jgi:hypothetical protein